MKSIIVIKASCISNYFPERYEVRFQGKTLLAYLVDRLKKSKSSAVISLATTSDSRDDQLVEEAQLLGVPFYRGDYHDSLGRIYGAACLYPGGSPDLVVKVLGNQPLTDYQEMDHLIQVLSDQPYQYAYNENTGGIIYGMGVEVFRFSLLQEKHEAIREPYYRRIDTHLFLDLLPGKDIYMPAKNNARPRYRVNLAVPKDVDLLNQMISNCEDLTHDGVVAYLDRNPVLVKYAQQNISRPMEMGLEKIMSFPQKLDHLHHAVAGEADLSYPISVELSLTNRCNLACEWCSDWDLRKAAMVDIEFESLRKLFHDLSAHGTKGVVIEGGGEPTIYSRFNEVVKMAKGFGLALGLITNGVDFEYQDCLEDFEWIRVSLDAANAAQFKQGKRVDAFDRVMANIQKMAAHAKVVGVGHVLNKYNEEGLEKLILNLRKINVDYFQIRPVIDHPELQAEDYDWSHLLKYSTDRFSVYVDNLKENTIRGNYQLPCHAHSVSTVITANGDVHICGRLNIYPWMKPMGNLYQQSFHDIWTGEKRSEQTTMVSNPEFTSKNCPECRLTKYNMLLHRASVTRTKNFI